MSFCRIGTLILFPFLLLLTHPTTSYSSNEIDTLIDKIQRVYDSTQTMAAKFTQETILINRTERMVAKGKVFFKKPGMMRWDYETPEEQKIISDGKRLWVYQPRFKQVMVSTPEEEGSAVKNFLSGMGRLKEDFSIHLEKEDEESYTLRLNTKDRYKNVDKLLLKVRKKDYLVIETRIFDIFGNITSVLFDKIEINPSIPSKFFHFEIPEGVRVVTPEGGTSPLK